MPLLSVSGNDFANIEDPLSDHSRRILERALEITEEAENPNLIVLHVNIFQRGNSVRRRDLRIAVHREVGRIQATYVVREGFILEEAILDEAVSQTIDHLVIGRNGRSKWRLFIRRVLDIGVDLETALTEELDIQLEVVD